MTQPIALGTLLPDVTLKDQDGNDVTLSALRGKKVLLSFHPLAWTPICRDQMQGLENAFDAIEALGVIPLGLSVDSVPCKKAWADSMGLKRLRVLADFWPHGGFAQSLGLFRERQGFSERANLLVDQEGKAAWLKVYEIKTLPDLDEVLSVLRG